jgi:hypothetical protein
VFWRGGYFRCPSPERVGLLAGIRDLLLEGAIELSRGVTHSLLGHCYVTCHLLLLTWGDFVCPGMIVAKDSLEADESFLIKVACSLRITCGAQVGG